MKDLVRVSEARTSDRLHKGLELRPKTNEIDSIAYYKGRLFQAVSAQHKNRRVAMFVDEDYVDNIS